MRIKEELSEKELIEKIMEKKEFSQLIKEDVKLVFEKFNKEDFSNEEKIKLTRALLKKVFSSFMGRRILNLKDKNSEWVLAHHVSTKERINFYSELYSRILGGEKSILDLGCGINGFSFSYLPKGISYFGVESVGQLVNLVNFYFKKNKLKGEVFHESLFCLNKLKDIFKKVEGRKIIFLFKVLDGLEIIQRNYSKTLLKEIVSLGEKVVVSFATRSLVRGTKFKANHNWLGSFIRENFKILDEFELGNERYLVFSKK